MTGNRVKLKRNEETKCSDIFSPLNFGDKPCTDRRDYLPLRSVLFYVNGPVHLLLPQRGLIVSVDDLELDVDVGMERRTTPVRRTDLDPVPGSLQSNKSVVEKKRKRGSEVSRKKGGGEGKITESKNSFGRKRKSLREGIGSQIFFSAGLKNLFESGFCRTLISCANV
jgi:hypothetical protein